MINVAVMNLAGGVGKTVIDTRLFEPLSPQGSANAIGLRNGGTESVKRAIAQEPSLGSNNYLAASRLSHKLKSGNRKGTRK